MRAYRLFPLLLLAACAGGPGGVLTPEQAVLRAAAEPDAGVPGVFELTVRATGRQDFLLYLNSEADYRDQRNLSIEVSRGVELALADRFGVQSLPDFLQNKYVRVRGIARRVRIDFIANGRRTGKYYYQTHLALLDADALSLASR